MKSYIYKSSSYGNNYETVIFYDIFIKLWTITHYCNDIQIGDSEYLNNKNDVLGLYDLKIFKVEGGK